MASLQAALSDEEEDAANEALTWFGYAETHSSGNGAGLVSAESMSVDESFDEDKLPATHSKDFQLSTDSS